MRAPPIGITLVVAVALAVASLAYPDAAHADDASMVGEGRRPGLGGRITRRSLTTAQNALYVIGGPWTPMLLGQRRDAIGYDGGVQLVHPTRGALAGLPAQASVGDDFGTQLNLGVAFGLYEHFEAGAMFLSFTFTPEFSYGGFPVYLTTWWEFGPVEVGARVVWFTFSDDPVDPDRRQTSLNPGVPVAVHLGTSRIDTGAFLTIGFRRMPFDFAWGDDDRLDVAPGLSVPLRYAVNPIPELTLGLETGFYDDDLGVGGDLSIPLGAFVGGTLLLGHRVLDVGVSFQWDQFLRPGAPAGVDALQPGLWRLNVGASASWLVM